MYDEEIRDVTGAMLYDIMATAKRIEGKLDQLLALAFLHGTDYKGWEIPKGPSDEEEL